MLHVGRVHVITDTTLQSRYSHAELASIAMEAGIPTIQYRRKDFDWEKHLGEVEQIIRLARRWGRQIIINDHVELAAKVGATGVHLGEEDMSAEEALRRLPALALIGVTIHSLERYAQIQHLPIAYVGVGPVFPTSTKSLSYPPLGVEGLRTFVENISHPVIAIGGITPERARELFSRIPRLHGVAVVSAFCTAENPAEIARELLAAVSASS